MYLFIYSYIYKQYLQYQTDKLIQNRFAIITGKVVTLDDTRLRNDNQSQSHKHHGRLF